MCRVACCEKKTKVSDGNFHQPPDTIESLSTCPFSPKRSLANISLAKQPVSLNSSSYPFPLNGENASQSSELRESKQLWHRFVNSVERDGLKFPPPKIREATLFLDAQRNLPRDRSLSAHVNSDMIMRCDIEKGRKSWNSTQFRGLESYRQLPGGWKLEH